MHTFPGKILQLSFTWVSIFYALQRYAFERLICIFNKYGKLELLVKALSSKFNIEVTNNVALYTIRHFDKLAINYIKNKVNKIVLEQRSTDTAQFVVID